MKILYLHQYFKTPQEGGTLRSYHVASAMVAAGHQVDLITAHNERDYLVKRVNGIRVHYLPVAYQNSFGKWQRIGVFLRFAWKAFRLAKKIKADLCYATSTPLTIGWIAIKLHQLTGLSYVFEVRDLWPLAPYQIGILQKGLMLRYAQYLEKKIYQRADKIIALSQGIADGIAQHVPLSKIEVIPNFSNNQEANIRRKENTKPHQKFHLDPDKKTVAYLGAMGKANHIELLEACVLGVSTLENVQMVMAGTGQYAHRLEALARSHQNIHFLGSIDKSATFDLLTLVDVTLTTFLDLPVLGTGSPNKFFDSLAFGCVSFVNNEGWISELIQKHDCGVLFNQENFMSQLTHIIENEARRGAISENSVRVARSFFDKDVLCQKIIQIVEGHEHHPPTKGAQVYTQTA